MSPDDIQQIISITPPGGVLLCTYQHKYDGQITTHQVIPFEVGVGRRSKTAQVMFWCYCLDCQRIEQREPANVISLETLSGNFDLSNVPTWS